MPKFGTWIFAAALACGACKKSDSQAGKHTGPLVVAEQPPLPEDPELAKRATAQWKKHLQKEEEERQSLFDRQRLGQHRAAIKQLTSARKLLDEAKGAQELAAAQTAVNARLGELRVALEQLDPWGNSTRLRGDYDALVTLLATDYGAARQAAFRGDGQPLTAARTQFDAHVRAMQTWLEHIQHEEDE